MCEELLVVTLAGCIAGSGLSSDAAGSCDRQVSIFSQLQESKFEHFRPVVDAYVSGHFAAALVYK